MVPPHYLSQMLLKHFCVSTVYPSEMVLTVFPCPLDSISMTLHYFPGVPVYLAPWTACPPGDKATAVCLPPGGQAVPGYLAPHPGYLHPRGEAVQAGLSCPPPNTSKNIYMLFVIFLYHFNELRSSIIHKVRNWCLWGYYW